MFFPICRITVIKQQNFTQFSTEFKSQNFKYFVLVVLYKHQKAPSWSFCITITYYIKFSELFFSHINIKSYSFFKLLVSDKYVKKIRWLYLFDDDSKVRWNFYNRVTYFSGDQNVFVWWFILFKSFTIIRYTLNIILYY